MAKVYSDIKFQPQETLKKGIDKISNTVKTTLGPSGKNVMLKLPYGHVSTKDGVSVAKAIELKDPIENIGAQLIKSVASRAADTTGDGTTTATVLAQGIYTEALKQMKENKNVRDLKNELDDAYNKIVEELDKIKTEVTTQEQIFNVAKVSANNDKELGKVVADAFSAVDDSSPITIEAALDGETSYKVIDGYQLDNGHISEHFTTNWSQGKGEYKNGHVLLTLAPINSLQPLEALLENCMTTGQALTIFTTNISQTAVDNLLKNKKAVNLNVNVVQLTGTQLSVRANMEDLSVLCGCEVIDPQVGDTLESITDKHIGTAKLIETTLKNSIIITDKESNKDALNALTDKIKNQIGQTTHAYDLDQLQKRLNRLSCKVGVISVAGRTEIEQKERQDRVDDALGAVRSAKEKGIVVGGGRALLHVSKQLINDNNSDGEKIIYNAIQTPFKQILTNAGLDVKYYIEKVLDKYKETSDHNYSVDVFKTSIENLFENGIIDPVKVILTSLESAISVTGELLTTDVVVNVVIPDDLKEE